MNATEQRVEEAIARNNITDADEVKTAPVVDDTKKTDDKKDDKPVDDKKVEDKKVEDKKPESPKYDKDGKRIEADDKKLEEAKPKEDDKKKDEKEYTADDALEVDAPKVPDAPITDASGIQLSAAEQKYVLDNIGEPMIIRGMRGTGDDAKEVELKVFDPSQIPRDFQFGSQADLLAAQQGFSRLETKAQSLVGGFRNQQSQTQTTDFENRENEGIRQDVSELQNAKEFPGFKVKPGSKGFDDDPAAKQMAEVLDIMGKRNDQYMKEYQQGRPYKHIGFKEAFDVYQKNANVKKQDTAQKTEDTERKQIADKVGTSRGMSANNVVRPTVKAGTTTRDLLNRIDNGDF
jgi:hypothetical protein